MNAVKLLKECKSKNITLRVVDDQLHYRAPRGALSDELKKQLRDYKPELIKTLSAELPPDYYNKHVETAICELNSRGVRMMDVPEINRRKADKIERRLASAANRGDRETFLAALREWRQCFH